MPKYDAFGREIGEDTLAGLGGGEDAHPPAAAVEPERQPPAGDEFASRSDVKPSPVAATPRFEAPAPSVRVRRRGGAGCLVALIVLAVIAAAPIIAIVSVVGSATDAIDEVQDAFDTVPEIPDVPELPADPPSGLRGESLYRVALDPADPTAVSGFERLLQGQYGRLRDVVEGPDGALYLATSNRDGRGSPRPTDDRLLRITVR